MSVPGKKEKEENAEVTPMRPTREEYSSNFFQNLYSDTKNFLGNQFPFGGPLIDRANLEIDKKAYPKKYFGTMDEQGKKSNTDNGIKVEQLTNDNNISNSETTLTPEKRSSNFKQTVDMGRSFDLTGNAFDSGAFSFIDDLGDNSEEQLRKVNATEDAAIDQGYKDAVEKTTTESMGAAKAGEKNRFSKTRGGLFGNYGKEVTINKIVNPETGKVSREKFVDGKYVSSTAERKNFRKQKKEGRQKGRQQKISDIKDKVTGVFEKSKKNREERKKNRSSKKNNNSGSSSNSMMFRGPY